MNNNYYQQNRLEMLDFIPLNSKKILDIGCGEGNFSYILKEKLKAEVWGIEKNETAFNLARKKLDKVLLGDATLLLDLLDDNYFDCLVLNDILEHLVDPYNFLEKLKSKLSQNGVIVFSVPNVRYLLNLKNLLINKDWRYENEGVLDKTHLRFFTKKSLINTFNQLNFNIIEIKGINPLNPWKFNIINFLFLGQLSDTKYLQFAGIIKVK